MEFSPALGDRLLQVVEGESEPDGLNHQLLDVGAEDAGALAARRGRRLADDRADAGTDFQQAFLSEGCDHTLGGVDVDLQFAAESADAGKWVSGAETSGQHGFLCGEGDLLVERNAGLQFQPERDHKCTMYLVTHKCKRSFADSGGCGIVQE